MTVSSIPSVFKKPTVSENIFCIFLTTIFQKIFPKQKVAIKIQDLFDISYE